MKRRSVAMILGLVMAITPVNVFAAESVENTETEVTEATEMVSDEGETIVGQVLAVEENSITIAEGMILDDAAAGSDDDETTAPDSNAEDAENDTENGTENEEASGEETVQDQFIPDLELTGEKRTVSVTEDTRISRMYMVTESKDGEAQDEKAESDENTASEEGLTEDEASVSEEMVSGDETSTSVETAGDESLVLEETGDEMNVELFIDSGASDSEQLELSVLKEGDIVSVTLEEDGNASEILVLQYNPYTDDTDADSASDIELASEDTATSSAADTEQSLDATEDNRAAEAGQSLDDTEDNRKTDAE